MFTAIISDLHLSPSEPELTKLFISFIETIAVKSECLYILGDLFQHWIGDDDHNPTIQMVIDALHHLTLSGIPVYFMHGNRDFLIGKKFLEKTGCQLLEDPTIVDLYGQKTLLTHGDIFCLNDKAYLKFRKIVRNNFIKKIFLMLPLPIRKTIVSIIRFTSTRKTSIDYASINERYDIPATEIIRLAKAYSVSQIIHGHTHNPTLHRFQINSRWINHFVLSDWGKQGHALIFEPEGIVRSVYF